MSDQLTKKKCVPCEGGVPALSKEDAMVLQQQLHGDWQLSTAGDEITRSINFKNYYETMAFVNAVAWMAHQENHHPDLGVHYNRCDIRYSTHAINGLSENDFICAAKVDKLMT